MGKKMKLKIEDLMVQSFVTSDSAEIEEQKHQKGGTIFRETACAHCTQWDTCAPCSVAFTFCNQTNCGNDPCGGGGGGGGGSFDSDFPFPCIPDQC